MSGAEYYDCGGGDGANTYKKMSWTLMLMKLEVMMMRKRVFL